LLHNIAERMPLDQVVKAHELVEQGKTLGNVVNKNLDIMA